MLAKPQQEKFHFLVNSLCLTPLAILAWDATFQRLGPHPIHTLTHQTGWWALLLLVLCLAVTPLQKLTGQNWIFGWRRTFGLFAFLYSVCHLSIFYLYEVGSKGLVAEILSHRYTMAGAGAFILLTPLAITSTKAWQKRLRKRWRTLHYLVFPAAFLAILHFFWHGKLQPEEPIKFALVLALLLLLRFPPIVRVFRLRKKPSERPVT